MTTIIYIVVFKALVMEGYYRITGVRLFESARSPQPRP